MNTHAVADAGSRILADAVADEQTAEVAEITEVVVAGQMAETAAIAAIPTATYKEITGIAAADRKAEAADSRRGIDDGL